MTTLHVKKVEVAVVQATPDLYDKKANIRKLVELAREAAAEGARIILFPESFIPGYPEDLNLDNHPDMTALQRQQRFNAYFNGAITESDEELYPISEVAEETGCYLAVGVTEREDDCLYCSVFFWGPEGEFLGKHRKLRPSGFEKLIWSKGEGSNLTTLATPHGVIGAAVCWENYMPLLRACLYAKGIDFYLIPAADSSEQWQSTLEHIALEGRCFVLCCNHYFPGVSEDNKGRSKYRGGSAIIDPDGNYLAGPLYDEEGILYAEIDVSKNRGEHYDFDPNPSKVPPICN